MNTNLAQELLERHTVAINVAVEDGSCFMVSEQDALDAIRAALSHATSIDVQVGLPPLPPVDGYDKRIQGHYSAQQMQDYARAALAATGKQQVGEAERERDLLAEAIHKAPIKSGIYRADLEGMTGPQLLMACDDMAECIKAQQVGEVQGNALVGDEMVQAFKAALSRAQLPGKPRTYFLKDSELPSILREVLAARQPGADEPVSPMAKMAAALREKAAIEHTEYSQRVQSGEWGTMPEAGTQADFCRYCEGSGWDGESRKTKCPDCSGTGMSRLLIGEAG